VTDETDDGGLELRELSAGRRVQAPLLDETRDRGGLLANLGVEQCSGDRLGARLRQRH
jgi:hypothetical protein